MYLDETMTSHLERCERRIAFLEEKIASFPEGELHSYANGKYRTWRISYPGGKVQYLSKENVELARILSVKRIYLAELHDLKTEAEACRRYLRLKNRSPRLCDKAILNMSPDLRALVGESFKTPDERISAWKNDPYEQYDKFTENLIHPTLDPELFVRSKVEAEGANQLILLEIPFIYEKVTLIGNIKIAVDFATLDIRTFQEIPMEIYGMMDNPDYRQLHNKKMKTYLDAGYIPGVNMLTFYESSTAPLNPMFMRDTLENFFHKNPPIQL